MEDTSNTNSIEKNTNENNLRILYIKLDPEYAESDAVVVDDLISKVRHVYLPGIFDKTKPEMADQLKNCFNKVDLVLRRAGGSLANLISMRTTIKDLIPEKQVIYSAVRKVVFDNNAIWPWIPAMYPVSMLTGEELGIPGVEVKLISEAAYEIPDEWEIRKTPHRGMPLQYTYGTYLRRQNIKTDISDSRGFSQAIVLDHLLTGVREVYLAGYNDKRDPDIKRQTRKTLEVLFDILQTSGGKIEDISTMYTSIPNLDKTRLDIFADIVKDMFNGKYPANSIIGTELATYVGTVEIKPTATFMIPVNWKMPGVYIFP